MSIYTRGKIHSVHKVSNTVQWSWVAFINFTPRCLGWRLIDRRGGRTSMLPSVLCNKIEIDIVMLCRQDSGARGACNSFTSLTYCRIWLSWSHSDSAEGFKWSLGLTLRRSALNIRKVESNFGTGVVKLYIPPKLTISFQLTDSIEQSSSLETCSCSSG